jgi:hypothetical protein
LGVQARILIVVAQGYLSQNSSEMRFVDMDMIEYINVTRQAMTADFKVR